MKPSPESIQYSAALLDLHARLQVLASDRPGDHDEALNDLAAVRAEQIGEWLNALDQAMRRFDGEEED